MIPDHLLDHAVKMRLPLHVRPGWGLIARNLTSPQSERDTEEVAAWIASHGTEHGFRTPNVRERGRAMGMMGYLEELELSEQDLYDAQGNSFDPQAVLLRMQKSVADWARGEDLVRHEFPSAASVNEAFAVVRDYVRMRVLNGVDYPFPHDLREWLLALERETQLSPTPRMVDGAAEVHPAAEHGRAGL